MDLEMERWATLRSYLQEGRFKDCRLTLQTCMAEPYFDNMLEYYRSFRDRSPSAIIDDELSMYSIWGGPRNGSDPQVRPDSHRTNILVRFNTGIRWEAHHEILTDYLTMIQSWQESGIDTGWKSYYSVVSLFPLLQSTTCYNRFLSSGEVLDPLIREVRLIQGDKEHISEIKESYPNVRITHHTLK